MSFIILRDNAPHPERIKCTIIIPNFPRLFVDLMRFIMYQLIADIFDIITQTNGKFFINFVIWQMTEGLRPCRRRMAMTNAKVGDVPDVSCSFAKQRRQRQQQQSTYIEGWQHPQPLQHQNHSGKVKSIHISQLENDKLSYLSCLCRRLPSAHGRRWASNDEADDVFALSTKLYIYPSCSSLVRREAA